MTKRDDKPEVKERLLVTGVRIFATNGFDGATVREICEQSGSNIAAINYYFGDKKGFFEAVKNYARQLRRKTFDESWALIEADPWGALRLRVEGLLDSTYDSMMFYVNWLFLRELLEGEEPAEQSPDSERERNRKLYEERMTRLLVKLLGNEAATPTNITLLRYTFYSLCQFLPIQTSVEQKFFKGKGVFNVRASVDKSALADFIMGTVRRTVEDMRRQCGVSVELEEESK